MAAGLFGVAIGHSYSQVGPGLKFVPDAAGLVVTGPANGQRFRMRITGEHVGRLRTKKKYWFRADSVRFEFFSEENVGRIFAAAH